MPFVPFDRFGLELCNPAYDFQSVGRPIQVQPSLSLWMHKNKHLAFCAICKRFVTSL